MASVALQKFDSLSSRAFAVDMRSATLNCENSQHSLLADPFVKPAAGAGKAECVGSMLVSK